jgi:hypothetical protein
MDIEIGENLGVMELMQLRPVRMMKADCLGWKDSQIVEETLGLAGSHNILWTWC